MQLSIARHVDKPQSSPGEMNIYLHLLSALKMLSLANFLIVINVEKTYFFSKSPSGVNIWFY